MPRHKLDSIDLACQEWAKQMVSHFVNAPEFGRDTLGSVRCVLDRVRSETVGTERNQYFPSLMTGEAYEVWKADKTLPEQLREILRVHYIIREYGFAPQKPGEPPRYRKKQWPTKVEKLCRRMNVPRETYFERVGMAKDRIAPFVP
jgi:hypothetical protein